MADAAPKHRWTPEEYLDAERSSEVRHVLWDGELFAMAGAAKTHNLLVAAILGELRGALRGNPCRPYASDQRVRLPTLDRYVYPDASVTCDPVEVDPLDAETITNPRLLVEVLSDSTEAFDRGEKWIGYQGIASLTDYLLLSQKTRRIEHYVRQPHGGWLLHTYGAGRVLSLGSFGITLAVDGVYEGISTGLVIGCYENLGPRSSAGSRAARPAVAGRASAASEVTPHPNPLPEGEGIEYVGGQRHPGLPQVRYVSDAEPKIAARERVRVEPSHRAAGASARRHGTAGGRRRSMLRRLLPPLVIGCLANACSGDAQKPAAAAPASAPPAAAAGGVSPDEARDVCKRVMLATRACGDLYVPALLRTRARFDQPPGIAARLKAEGEEKLVAIAREEFKGDWADPAIATHCQKLTDMPDDKRSTVVERERSCLPEAGDCKAFVDCNMRNLERKWSAPLPAGAASK